MPFWSSQTFEKNLAQISSDPDPDFIDCNALELRLGSEIYITPSIEMGSPEFHTKQKLKKGEARPIPPGQFAFLLSEEKITIPKHLMGFISIKAGYKLKGLVNVSGFHVDPGWTGRLIFTVFNAGPAPVHVQQGERIFLIWIAALDEASEKHKTKKGSDSITPGILNNISGAVNSVYGLESRLRTEISIVSDKVAEFRREVSEVKERQSKVLLGFGIGAAIIAALMGVTFKAVADMIYDPAANPALRKE